MCAHNTWSACLQPGQQPCPLEDRLYTSPLVKTATYTSRLITTVTASTASPLCPPAGLHCHGQLLCPRLQRHQQLGWAVCSDILCVSAELVVASLPGGGLPVVSGCNSLMGGEAGCRLVRLAPPAARARPLVWDRTSHPARLRNQRDALTTCASLYSSIHMHRTVASQTPAC